MREIKADSKKIQKKNLNFFYFFKIIKTKKMKINNSVFSINLKR